MTARVLTVYIRQMAVNTNGTRLSKAAREVIELLGGTRATARLIGVTPRAVQKWKSSKIPAERVLELERLCDARITRYRMRPDVFGAPR